MDQSRINDLSRQVQNLKARGVALPRHPQEAQKSAAEMHRMASSPGELRRDLTQFNSVRNSRIGMDTRQSIEDLEANARIASAMRKQRLGSVDASVAIPRFYDPMEYWDLSGLPWNMADEGHRHKLHKWMRLYYATHYLVPILIDIFTRFPLAGMHVESKDHDITDFYSDLFLNQLNYEDFLVELGREYWLVGGAYPLGSFNENLGVWEREELINPELIVIENVAPLGDQQIKLVPSESLKTLARTRMPANEYKQLKENFPDIIPYLLRDEPIPVSDVLLRQIAFKTTNWDAHGTPILLRALRTLIHEEKLLASQDAVAERLYSPLLLAKLGAPDMGGEYGPWLPAPDQLDEFRDDLDLALSSDFRVMVYHYALEMQSVFGREQVPDLGSDFDRIERRLMQCLQGDTLVHTRDGLIPARDLEGKTIEVLSLDGVYRESKWSNYGEQELFTITLENGDTLEATAGHEWLVTQGKPKHKRVTTLDLVGRRIPMQHIADSFDYQEEEWQEGVRHGLVYGDGWLYLDGRYTMVRQHGDSMHLLYDHFDRVAVHKINHTSSGLATAAQTLPREYKTLPELDVSPSYMRGFIAGFIAADGNIASDGRVILTQSSYEDLQHVREMAKRCGLPTVSIRPGQDNELSTRTNWRLSFVKAGFFESDGVIDRKMILKEKHRDLMTNSSPAKRQRYSVKVVDVRPSGRSETVYCCVEPETHSFVIDNHYLTGNCFGINPSLLEGGSSGEAYASTALHAEFMNQMLRTFQGYLKKHFQHRVAVVAEARGHYDYEMKGDRRVPIMEDVVTYDEEGRMHIEQKPKLIEVNLEMPVLDMRSEATERAFRQNLRSMGVPIPDDKLMVGVNFEFDDALDEMSDEIMKKTIKQQETKMKTYEALKARGLPIPPGLKAEVEGIAQQGMPGGDMGAPGAGMGAEAPMGDMGSAPGGGSTVIGPPMPSDLAQEMGGPPPAEPFTPGPEGARPDVSDERRGDGMQG